MSRCRNKAKLVSRPKPTHHPPFLTVAVHYRLPILDQPPNDTRDRERVQGTEWSGPTTSEVVEDSPVYLIRKIAGDLHPFPGRFGVHYRHAVSTTAQGFGEVMRGTLRTSTIIRPR